MSLRVEYTNDDLCDKENLTPRIITHCVDNSGRWSQKGIMGKITTTYGKSVKELYEKNHKSNENNEIGDIQTLKISKEDEPDLYICTIVGQIYPFEKKGSTPQVSYSGFESALKEISTFAKSVNLPVHFEKLHPSIPNLVWEDIEKLFVEHLIKNNIKVVIHTKEKLKAKPFENCICVISGFSESDTEDVAEKIISLGGEVRRKWQAAGKNRTSHLICEKATDMYQQFLEFGGGSAVTREWVNQSHIKYERCSEEEYSYPEKKNSSSEKKRKHESPEPEVVKKKKEEKSEPKGKKQVEEKIEEDIKPKHHKEKSETPPNSSEKKSQTKKKDLSNILNQKYYLCKVYNQKLLERYIIAFGGQILSKDQAKTIICDGDCCKKFEYSYQIWDKINQLE